jgi:hypothetical protein
MSHEHNHHEFVEGTPNERATKFIKSGLLRSGSALIQAVGGIAGGNPALVVEAAEEMTDAMTFGAAAIEVRSNKKGVVAKARRMAISFAIGASSIASFEFGSELVGDKFSLNKPTEGLNFAHSDIKAASVAIALNAVVLFINRKGKDSKKTSDKFAYRDSLRDFVIPASVLGIAVVQAPHWAEYIFEAGGVSYGWYNTKQLYNGWKKPKK